MSMTCLASSRSARHPKLAVGPLRDTCSSIFQDPLGRLLCRWSSQSPEAASWFAPSWRWVSSRLSGRAKERLVMLRPPSYESVEAMEPRQDQPPRLLQQAPAASRANPVRGPYLSADLRTHQSACEP